MKDTIQIDSVFLEYGELKVLRGASLTIACNQVIGILGRNGCGKSCLLKIITGQIQPQFKYINYKGQQLLNLYKEQGLINYLPQHEFHPKSIRVERLLYYYGIDADQFVGRYSFFKDYLSLKFSKLSGGERRLVEVLIVLEAASKFTILDEPFSHIMPNHIAIVKERITELRQHKGIIVTDHQYENVMDVSDNLYLLKDGVIGEVKDKEDLKWKGYIL
ncbi:MAG: ATP-binding cassette domain-containing protein [Saprospiraceae bacterium]